MNFSIADKAERWAAFWKDVGMVMPEIWLVIAMCAVVLVPFINRRNIWLPIGATVIGLVFSLVFTIGSVGSVSGSSTTVFAGMLAIDPFSQFFKFILLIFTLLIIAQWLIAKKDQPRALDTPDFLCLLLGAAFGMSLMASANNLLMLVVATEAASLPSFALAGFRKFKKSGSEGSLKYVIFGAASSAFMIYGMSLIYGATGTLDLNAVANAAAGVSHLSAAESHMTVSNAAEAISSLNLANAASTSPMLAIGLMLMFVGIAFKLSAAPVHFWCPDVFQGAPIGVTTFLSVASKGAAVILLVRVLLVFSVGAEEAARVSSGFAAMAENAVNVGAPAELFEKAKQLFASYKAPTFTSLAAGIGILGAVTATWGNLVALGQSNLKRMLAYSSIAHAGYMIMGASVMVYAGTTGEELTAAVLFYLLVYVFMNLGAFTVVAIMVERTGSEEIEELTGLGKRTPALAFLLSVFLLSLFGMPGLGGFMGKFLILIAMKESGPGGYALMAALLLNTVISLYYYMRPVYTMVFKEDTQDRGPIIMGDAARIIMVLCAVALFWTGFGGGTSLTRGFTNMYRPGQPDVEDTTQSKANNAIEIKDETNRPVINEDESATLINRPKQDHPGDTLKTAVAR